MRHRFMCKHKSMTTSPLILSFFQLVLKFKLQDDASSCWVCHRRFHDILPKEHPGAFYEVPWGLYKGMFTNTRGQSDIVTHPTNILNKDYRNSCKWTFFYTANFDHQTCLSKSYFWYFIDKVPSIRLVGSNNFNKSKKLRFLAFGIIL